MRIPLLALLVATVCATSCATSEQRSLTENVGATFSPCDQSEIKFLAAKHNFQLAFRPCGNNNFDSFSWSPTGTHLYFELVMSGHVMNADRPDKRTFAVPTAEPTGDAAWLSGSRLVLPVVADADDAPERLAIVDITDPDWNEDPEAQVTTALMLHPVPGLTAINDLSRGDKPTQVLFSAKDTDGLRSIYQLDFETSEVSPAFDWLEGAVHNFTYTPSQTAVVVANDDGVTLFNAKTGEITGSWTVATRGSLHGEGRWLALEHLGASRSVFGQRSWNEVSENARQREQARIEQFKEELPGWLDTEVRPPMISVVDLTTGERWQFTSFLGSQFQWYEAYGEYASLILWGFEGKEVKRNVILGNMADRLQAIDEHDVMMGVEPFIDPTRAVDEKPDADSEPAQINEDPGPGTEGGQAASSPTPDP